MNKLAVQRQSRPLLPELSAAFHWLARVRRSSPVLRQPPDAARRRDQGRHLRGARRAAGVDPIEDIEVTVRDGRLTIKAMRTRTRRVERALGVLLRIVHPNGAAACGRRRGRHQCHLRQGHPHRFGAAVRRGDQAEKHVEVFEIAPLDEDGTMTTSTSRGPTTRTRRTVDQSQGEDQPEPTTEPDRLPSRRGSPRTRRPAAGTPGSGAHRRGDVHRFGDPRLPRTGLAAEQSDDDPAVHLRPGVSAALLGP